MKIAIITGALKTGGAERQALLCASELKKLGHETCIVIYHPIIEYGDIIKENNINVVEIKTKAGRVGRIFALASFLRKEKYDVVHSFSGGATITMALATRLTRTRVVLGGYRAQYQNEGMMYYAHKLINRFLNGWIVNSKAIVDSMVKSLGFKVRKFHVLYNGISADTFTSTFDKTHVKNKLDISHDTSVITMIARLHPIKNYKMLMDIARNISHSNRKTLFLIVGGGPSEDEIKDYAKSIGVGDNVRFLGRRTDVPDILAATDISVLTSNFEGFPNTLIEAMSVGIPVITTDYPGIEELVEDGVNGLIVPCGDAAAFTDAILKVQDSPQLYDSLSNNGIQYVYNNLSPQTMAKNLENIYKKFLPEK